MMNYKCKSHRGRYPLNRSDALVIAEVRNGRINRVWAEIIPNKCATTLLPIICDHVLGNTTIHTDEHVSYRRLASLGYTHKSVIHKYMFVDIVNNVDTQAVESFNNCLKHEIKSRKGVRTTLRTKFLTEFIWCWNRKDNLFKNF